MARKKKHYITIDTCETNRQSDNNTMKLKEQCFSFEDLTRENKKKSKTVEFLLALTRAPEKNEFFLQFVLNLGLWKKSDFCIILL